MNIIFNDINSLSSPNAFDIQNGSISVMVSEESIYKTIEGYDNSTPYGYIVQIVDNTDPVYLVPSELHPSNNKVMYALSLSQFKYKTQWTSNLDSINEISNNNKYDSSLRSVSANLSCYVVNHLPYYSNSSLGIESNIITGSNEFVDDLCKIIFLGTNNDFQLKEIPVQWRGLEASFEIKIK